ncbi:MAG: Hsp20/alpha crystallin family protein [Verrucomicrobia bacterium]|nr:Hsp20/alpha crystallin family protein [Verrucomicrobiota bacterium]
MDIHESENGLELTAELPGVSQNDLDLRIEGDVLTIRGEKQNERQGKHAHVVERSYGSFQRSVQLPFAPDPA